MNEIYFDDFLIRLPLMDYLMLDFICERGECTAFELKSYMQEIIDVSRQTFYSKLNKLYKKEHYITQKYHSCDDNGNTSTKIYYTATDVGKEFYEKTAKLISKASA